MDSLCTWDANAWALACMLTIGGLLVVTWGGVGAIVYAKRCKRHGFRLPKWIDDGTWWKSPLLIIGAVVGMVAVLVAWYWVFGKGVEHVYQYFFCA